jgi:hypothetical protein
MVVRKDRDESFRPAHVIKRLTGSVLPARLMGNLDTGKATAPGGERRAGTNPPDRQWPDRSLNHGSNNSSCIVLQ